MVSSGGKSTPGAGRASNKLAWTRLSIAQRTALAPLAGHWIELSETQKLKWMALSRHFDALPATEQERLHSRMSDWAALTMQQRAQARITFAQASALPPAEKKARWEAYQSLTPQEREKLAEENRARPHGAAPAVRPVARDRPTEQPISAAQRENEHPPGKHGLHESRVNRTTLLPQRTFPHKPAPPADHANPGEAGGISAESSITLQPGRR